MCISGIQNYGMYLDWINIMSYDAGTSYDPIKAFKAYRSYYDGPLMLGVEVPPEAWGGHMVTLSEVQKYVNCILDDEKSINNGIFVWRYQKNGKPSCSDIIQECIKVFKDNPSKVITGWQSGVNYSAGSTVLYNGETYFCTADHPSSNYSLPGLNLWVNKKLTHSPKLETPIWVENVNYLKDQLVIFNSKVYRCVIPHTSISAWHPEIETNSLWKLE